jgi:hypothetical protein
MDIGQNGQNGDIGQNGDWTEWRQLSAARRKIPSADEGVFLVVLRDGAWKLEARSLMGA